MKWINKLERSLYKYPIKPFFKYIVFAMGGVYILNLFFPTLFLPFRLALVKENVLAGEIWRLVSFLFLPFAGSPFATLLSLYFYYFIGTSLERRWGARRFLIYYLFGTLGTIMGAFISGYAPNTYLNLSLFFAFAIEFPEFQILLFFFFPIKMKWLALINALFFLASFIYQPFAGKIAILFSLLNLFLFFGGDIYNRVRQEIYQYKRRKAFKDQFK
ncbi:MAG: hypothetical protein Q4E07_06890 [Eubacteriales bacterium]|nr:hypothetical protein [Eubacteriales bacterium]